MFGTYPLENRCYELASLPWKLCYLDNERNLAIPLLHKECIQFIVAMNVSGKNWYALQCYLAAMETLLP